MMAVTYVPSAKKKGNPMNKYDIEYQVDALIKAGFIPKGQKKKACQVLKEECWTDKIADVWSIEEVKERAEENGITITDDEARDILVQLDDDYDANDGINWEVIDTYL